jgi:hypothetical protein
MCKSVSGNANQNHTKIPHHPCENSYHQKHHQQVLSHCWWESKLVKLVWKKVWRLLKNLNIDLPYNPAITFLGIYPKECDTGYFKGTCIPMFIAALFTVVKL